MPDIRRMRTLVGRLSVVQLLLGALVAAVTLAVVGAAAPTHISEDTAAGVPSPSATSAGPTRAAPSGSTAPVTTGVGVAPQGVLHPAPLHTMSMDVPIQHGLTAHQEQAIAARLLRTHHDADVARATGAWSPEIGRSAVARAESWLGMPYSWAGGNASGPTLGRCVRGSGGDLDCHVVGFDCSGLMMYAWGPYAALPHLAATQRTAGGFHPTLDRLRPGDLVFFAGYLPNGTGHVAMYSGHGMVIEAPQSGSVIRRTSLASVLASDGAYRGAVRPLTGATPTLTAPDSPVPTSGGEVTLRGANLLGVDAVHLNGVTVDRFVRRSDSALVFHVPGHRHGTVAVMVSTPWGARSSSVPLAFVRPPTKSPVTIRPTPTSSATPHPTLSPSTSPKPTPTHSATPKPSASSSARSVSGSSASAG